MERPLEKPLDYLKIAYKEFRRLYTLKEYNQLASRKGWLSGYSIVYICGKSWDELLDDIVIENNRGYSTISLKDAVSHIQHVHSIIGKMPSVQEYTSIAKQYHLPGYRRLMRNTQLKWSELKEFAKKM